MRGNVENKNNNPVNIRFADKTSDIRNLSENITSDVMLTQKCITNQGCQMFYRGKVQMYSQIGPN